MDSIETTTSLKSREIIRKVYDFFASARLALLLMAMILVSSLVGVTILRGREAWEIIFSSIWFNTVLILLVLNVACCFFGRIWGKRVTLISSGMILFHLSFVVILLAIIYNSLFFFRATIRLTEGETIPAGDPLSYDQIEKGRFFNFKKLTGDVSLIRMHRGYTIGGEDKRVAYEISVGEEGKRTTGIIFVTHKLTHNGFDYFNDREGYSVLVMMSDLMGNDLYGVHVPLQSITEQPGRTSYSTGYRDWEKLKVVKGVIPFPAPPEKTRFGMQLEFIPSKEKDRDGELFFRFHPLGNDGLPVMEKVVAEGKVPLNQTVTVGDVKVRGTEIRYWVGMLVRHEPGYPIILGSLWVALGGLVITTVGRMVKRQQTVRGESDTVTGSP